MILLVILIAIPLIEIAVMIKVGQWIGLWPALGIVFVTGVAGSMILARSGLSSALKVQEAMVKGEPPVAAMLDGALVVMAGLLLITPGFIADLIGLALLVPAARSWVSAWALRNMVIVGAEAGAEHRSGDQRASRHTGPEAPFDETGPSAGPVIEGEFERLDERPVDAPGRPPDGPPARP